MMVPPIRARSAADAVFAPAMLLLMAALTGGASVALAGLPRGDAVPLWLIAALPAAAGVGCALRRHGVRHAWPAALGGFALAALPVLLLPPRPADATVPWSGFVGGYEIGNLVSAGLVAWHAWRGPRDDGRRWVLFGGLAFGLGLENSGIVLGYFSELGYHAYVPGLPAPVATMIGWPVVLYLADQQARNLLAIRPLPARWLGPAYALLLTATALAADAQIDPYATRMGLWVWRPDLLVPPLWFGVPPLNYLAWAGAVLGFAAATLAWRGGLLATSHPTLRLAACFAIGYAVAGAVFFGCETLVLPAA
jgi:hypothetical protein